MGTIIVGHKLQDISSLLRCDDTKSAPSKDYFSSLRSMLRRTTTIFWGISFDFCINQKMLQFHIFLCGLRLYSGRKTNKQTSKKVLERNRVQKQYNLNTRGEQALKQQPKNIQNREDFSCNKICKQVFVDKRDQRSRKLKCFYLISWKHKGTGFLFLT